MRLAISVVVTFSKAVIVGVVSLMILKSLGFEDYRSWTIGIVMVVAVLTKRVDEIIAKWVVDYLVTKKEPT